jgi:hypothetical protein
MPYQFIVMGSVTPIFILNLNRIFIHVSVAVYAHVVTVRTTCFNKGAVHIATQGIYVAFLRSDSDASEDSDLLRPDTLFLA